MSKILTHTKKNRNAKVSSTENPPEIEIQRVAFCFEMISVFQLSPLLSLKDFEGSCLKGSENVKHLFLKFQGQRKMLIATVLLFLVFAVVKKMLAYM